MKQIEGIFQEPDAYDFFLAARTFEFRNPALPKIGDAATKADDFLRFGQDPFFAFPDANIGRARQRQDGQTQLFVRFLGLLGPQGGMPLTLTEEAYLYSRDGDDALARFCDLMNHRFIQLFFRAWADSRGHAHRDRPETDAFERYVGSGIGLGSPALRDLDSVPDVAKAAFSGIMGAKAKSASRLASVVRGLFGVKVEIDEFVGVRLLFDPDQRSRIGQAFSTLGGDVLVGAGVYSVQDKFRLRLYTSSLAEYSDLLPSGPRAKKLADLVFFYVGAEVDWDVELALPVGEVSPVRLGKSGQLGWTSWMAPDWTVEKGAYRKDARFDLAKRFGHG